MELQDRYRGALVGLAVGDALGTTLEFQAPGSFRPIAEMVGGGPFGLRPGEWTDDTSMALCLGESLLETGSFDPRDQMSRYVQWWKAGHLSSNGRCFDIGNTVRNALAKYQQTREPFAGSADPNTAGNGSLMRLAPVALAYRADPVTAVHFAGESSRTTHGARAAVDACRFFAALLVGALDGLPKDDLLAPDYFASHPAVLGNPSPLDPAIARVAAGSYRQKKPPAIRGTGYVVQSLEAALWAFASTGGFETGALAAVNLGEDADTTGAVYGQLAGAHYGVNAIPARWRERLALHDVIVAQADGLLAWKNA